MEGLVMSGANMFREGILNGERLRCSSQVEYKKLGHKFTFWHTSCRPVLRKRVYQNRGSLFAVPYARGAFAQP